MSDKYGVARQQLLQLLLNFLNPRMYVLQHLARYSTEPRCSNNYASSRPGTNNANCEDLFYSNHYSLIHVLLKVWLLKCATLNSLITKTPNQITFPPGLHLTVQINISSFFCYIFGNIVQCSYTCLISKSGITQWQWRELRSKLSSMSYNSGSQTFFASHTLSSVKSAKVYQYSNNSSLPICGPNFSPQPLSSPTCFSIKKLTMLELKGCHFQL